MELADAKRFIELEKEFTSLSKKGWHTELKKLLAEQMLKNQVLEETLSKKG